MQDSQLFLTGSYAPEDVASICLWELQKKTGLLKKLDSFSGFCNPSYLVASEDHKQLYAISEREYDGGALAFCMDEGYRLKLLKQLPAMGKLSCHLAVSGKHNLLVAANYLSGSLSVFQLDKNGGLKNLSGVVDHGKLNGIPAGRPAHAHFVMFSDETDKLLAADLGLDKVFVYQIDPRTGSLHELESERISLPQGSGPRHIAVNPQKQHLLYVICEFSSQVYVVKTGAEPQILQCISTLPEQCAVQSFAAAVKLSGDGRFLYASNRGFNSIAVFETDAHGLLKPAGIVDLQGDYPRDFDLFDDFAVVAYQKSNWLEVFQVDQKTGLFQETKITAEALAPVCVCSIG